MPFATYTQVLQPPRFTAPSILSASHSLHKSSLDLSNVAWSLSIGIILFGLLISTRLTPFTRHTYSAHFNYFDHKKSCKFNASYCLIQVCITYPLIYTSVESYIFLRIFFPKVKSLFSLSYVSGSQHFLYYAHLSNLTPFPYNSISPLNFPLGNTPPPPVRNYCPTLWTIFHTFDWLIRIIYHLKINFAEKRFCLVKPS